MKILHAGWGFQPFRKGGLIEYAEDLMEIQVSKGYEVLYFCTGRSNIFRKGAFLSKWNHKKGFTVYELQNPPIITGLDFGMDKPLLDLNDPETEAVFLKIVQCFKPQIVHFQEFLGIPTSVLHALKALGIKTVYTAEDYFPLCPTLKLVRYDRKLCTIKGPDLGAVCAVCCRYAPVNSKTYRFESMFGVFKNRLWVALKPFVLSSYSFVRWVMRKDNFVPPTAGLRAAEFNTRRDQNLSNLQACDFIIAMSGRVKEIFQYYTELDNIIALNLTLGHMASLRPYLMPEATDGRLTLGIVNAMGTYSKGRNLLFELFAIVDKSTLRDKVTFYVLGDIFGDSLARLAAYPFIQYKGSYKTSDLNSLLESLGIQVGLVPSVWEEAYAYVGIEFLAKGIPVIGNKIGGITDYLIDDQTGWLNKSCTAEEMFQIISGLVEAPEKILTLNRNLVTNRDRYIKSMDTHFLEMDSIYERLLSGVPVSTDAYASQIINGT